MFMAWWRPALARRRSRPAKSRLRPRPSQRPYRPQLEWLEDRRLLATFLVTNTNDSGDGSLRQAILAANANAGLDTIDFNIPGNGVQTIAPLSALPRITDPVIIDGYSQPGASANTLANGDNAVLLIEVNGANAGGPVPVPVDGLDVTAGNSQIRGLVISGFSGHGVHLITNGTNIIAGNFIGTDPAGATALANGEEGVFIDGSPNNTIGGSTPAGRNLVSGNAVNGVLIDNAGATANLVEGNYLGVNAAGTAAIPNAGSGVDIANAGLNTVGGTITGARNLISGNAYGITIGGGGFTGNSVQGNFIGTDVTGTIAIPNRGSGVVLSNGPGNLIGGTLAGAGNVISGNGGDGIQLTGSATTNNVIDGNNIGTDVTGTKALRNAIGVELDTGAANNTIGNTAGNVISANFDFGILLRVSAGQGNTILANRIGTDINGTSSLGGGPGVEVFAAGTTIGSASASRPNVISGNQTTGVLIDANGAIVQGNFIGTDRSGTVALPNRGNGVDIAASGDVLGGTATGDGNVISGNIGNGVVIFGAGAVIQGNKIGTDVNGTAMLGNGGRGIFNFNSSSNTIGGTTSGTANIIAFNGGSGVSVDSGTGNAIRENSIFSNSNLGIHLNSANNANNNQAFPVLTSISSSAGGTTISGTLTSTPSTTFNLDFFSNTTADPSGFGQGQTFLGTATATTDANGNANFTVTVSTPVPSGQPAISATATDPNGNTSEFAKDIHVPLTANGTAVAATEGAAFTGVVATFTDSDTGVSSGNFTATINWGDGSTSSGTITALPPSSSGSNFQVTGSHTYAEEGSFTVTTKIHDTMDNLDATATSPATAADAALTAAPVAVCSAEGIPVSNMAVATFTDASGAEPVGNYTATLDWGDGTAASAGTIAANGSTLTVLGSHVYRSEGTYTVHVSIQDDGGSTAGPTATATIGGFVTGLYQEVLSRMPDAPGLRFWVTLVHAGVPREPVAEAFWVSPEHRGLEVDQFYKTFLRRAADAGGRAFWVNALLAGATENDVSVAFLVSGEYTQSHPDTDSYITGLYNDVYGRAPDSGGFFFWTQILDNAVRSRAAIAYYFLTATEAYLQAIDDYYLNFLGRRPAAGEEQLFLEALINGATPAAITTIFLGSPEFVAREIATACRGM